MENAWNSPKAGEFVLHRVIKVGSPDKLVADARHSYGCPFPKLRAGYAGEHTFNANVLGKLKIDCGFNLVIYPHFSTSAEAERAEPPVQAVTGDLFPKVRRPLSQLSASRGSMSRKSPAFSLAFQFTNDDPPGDFGSFGILDTLCPCAMSFFRLSWRQFLICCCVRLSAC